LHDYARRLEVFGQVAEGVHAGLLVAVSVECGLEALLHACGPEVVDFDQWFAAVGAGFVEFGHVILSIPSPMRPACARVKRTPK